MAHVCASDSRSCSMAAVAFMVTLVPSSTSGQQPDSGMRSLGHPCRPAASDAGLSGTGWDQACSGDHIQAGQVRPHPLELGGTALRQRTCTWAALAVPVGLASVRRPGGRAPGPGPAHGHGTRLPAGNTQGRPCRPFSRPGHFWPLSLGLSRSEASCLGNVSLG